MDQMACLWRDSQATVALPTPLCETGPQHLSTPSQAFGGESAASLVRTSVGPSSNQEELWGRRPQAGLVRTCFQSGWPSHSWAVCSPLQFQGHLLKEAVHDCPTGACHSDHITLFYFVGQSLLTAFCLISLFPPTRMQAPGEGALSLRCRSRYPPGPGQS